MTVSRANVEATKQFIRARLGNPYVYGGALSLNVKQGTDCSEVWQTVLEMVHGRWKQGRQTEGATTESYRYIGIGGTGPFGTIRVGNWRDIPANAAAKLAFHHGPGGGANSHMWGELDGMLIESAGSKGLVTNGRAMTIDNPYATAWAYLPGPIDGVAGPPPPLGQGSYGPDVVALQQRLNTEGAGLEVDGDYGPKTADAVASWDRRTRYAKLVLAEGQRRNVTPRGIQIAFSVCYVESNWRMYANAKVPESMSIPHDAVGADYDSVGLFQQRCPMWGPANVLMDPTKSAGLFYDRLVKLDYNGNRPAGDYAADVQRPAAQYRGRYQERMGHAVALYNRLVAAPSTPPPPTPAPTEGFLMALSDSEQREVLDAARRRNRQRPSTSPLRHLGEGNVGDEGDFTVAADGHGHVQLVKLLAELGHPESLALLKEVADADPTRYPDRQEDRKVAQAILSELGKPAVANSVNPALATPVSVPATVDTAQLSALHEENARLREELARLQSQPQYVPAVLDTTESAPQTSGAIAGQVFDSVESWTEHILSMDTKQRAAFATSLKALELPNGAQS